MGEQFKPGDLVECVDASPGRHTGRRLSVGAVYTVTMFEPGWTDDIYGDVDDACDVAEASAQDCGFNSLWKARRFRLYRSPNIEALIRSAKSPVVREESRDGATPKKERTHA